MIERSLEAEILDDPNTPASEIKASLDFMTGINRYFGGTQVILDYFRKHAGDDHFTVLDLGTGSGDIPFELAKWARRRGQRARITALDLNPICLEYAQRRFGSPDVKYLAASAFEIDKLGQYDYVTSSMFFHHLTDPQIVQLLSLIAQTAKKGFIINDLYRGQAAYWGAGALALFSRRRIVMNDATLSVKRAFKGPDLERLAGQAGLPNYNVERKPWFRVSLSGTW